MDHFEHDLLTERKRHSVRWRAVCWNGFQRGGTAAFHIGLDEAPQNILEAIRVSIDCPYDPAIFGIMAAPPRHQ